MKLTWFAGTTVRVHIGGQILVGDPARVPGGVDAREIMAGADQIFGLAESDAHPRIDPTMWRPRRAGRPIEADADGGAVEILRIAAGAILIAATGEPPLVLIAGTETPRFGRWADDPVVVLFGTGETLAGLGKELLDVARPRLVALAAGEAAVELAVAELREHLDGAGLVALEPGLGLEV